MFIPMKKMLKDKYRLKLRSLDKKELGILAQKLGMKKYENRFQNNLYNFFFPPKSGDIMEHIRRNPQNRKVVEVFLDVLDKLNRLDINRLSEVADKLEIDIPENEKEPIKKIVAEGDLGDIDNKLNTGRVLILRVSGLALIVSIAAYFYKLDETEMTAYTAGMLWLIAGWAGGMASILGLFPIPDEGASWKEKVAGWWMTNRMDAISILLFAVFFAHPPQGRLFLLAIIAGTASLASVIFNFSLPNWYKTHFQIVYHGITIVLAAMFLSVYYFIIAGEVIDSKNPLVGAKVWVEIQKENKKTEKNGVNKKMKDDKKSSFSKFPICKTCEDEKGFLCNIIEEIHLCEAQTDKDGKFALGLIPSILLRKEMQVNAEHGGNKSDPEPFSLGERYLKISINKKLLNTKWNCIDDNDASTIIFDIINEDHKITTTLDENSSSVFSSCFDNKEFYYYAKKFYKGQCSLNGKNLDIKITSLKGKDGKVEIILKGKEREISFSLSCIKGNPPKK